MKQLHPKFKHSIHGGFLVLVCAVVFKHQSVVQESLQVCKVERHWSWRPSAPAGTNPRVSKIENCSRDTHYAWVGLCCVLGKIRKQPPVTSVFHLLLRHCDSNNRSFRIQGFSTVVSAPLCQHPKVFSHSSFLYLATPGSALVVLSESSGAGNWTSDPAW